MAQSSEDKAKAAAIVGGWTWQIAEGHNYRYRHATRTLTRFYEAASMQPDEVKLVVEYLRDQEIAAGEGISILNRPIDFGEGWKAKDAWYQTAPGERFANTDSTKVRVFQILFQAPEDADADGPYAVENGCAYKSTNEFHWDVEELPSLPASSSGVEYSMRGVTRDRETGLFSCVIEKRERVQQDVAEYLSAKTVFEKRSVEQHLGVKADKVATAGKAASAGDGTLVTRRITKNADCTSDVTNETTEETAVEGAATSTHVSLTGTTTRTVNRNMKDKAPDEGLGVGESVENAKTDGGRWNQTIVKVDRDATLDVLDTCQKTAFEHSHGKVTVQGAKPDAVDVDVAADGKVQKKTVRLTEDGSYRVEDETTEETAVEGAVVETRKTVSGVTTTTLDRNQESAAKTDGLAVGESVRVEKTPGGLYNNTKTTTEATNATLQTACEHSAGVHTDIEVKNEAKADKDCIEKPGANVVKRKSSRLNENGTYDNETRTTTYEPDSKTANGGSANAAVETTVATNQTTPPTSGASAVNVEERVSLSLNEHGSMTVNKTTTTYTPATATATTKWATETVTTTTTRHDTNRAVTPSGEYGSSSASPDDNGAATTSETSVTPNEIDSDWITWESTTVTSRGKYKYKHGLRVFCNKTTPPTPPSGSNCSLNVHVNKFGRYDGSMSYTDLDSWEESSSGSGDEGGSSSGKVHFYIFRQTAEGKTQKRQVSLGTVSYHGSGNFASESSAAANATIVAGLKLPARTYGTGSPTFGSWEDAE